MSVDHDEWSDFTKERYGEEKRILGLCKIL